MPDHRDRRRAAAPPDGKAGNYLITGPGWKGEVPAGMKQIRSPTRYIVILGRTYADGTEEDYKAVNALQAQYKITPLSAWGKPYTYVAPPVDPNPGFSMTDKPQEVILAMGTDGYFNLMAKLMGDAAPPAAEDAPMLAKMAKIGIVPGKPFDMTQARSGRAGRAEGPAEDRARRRSRPTRISSGRDRQRLGDHQGPRRRTAPTT